MKFSKLFGFITAFDINRDKGKSQNPKNGCIVLATKSMLVTVHDGCWRPNMLVTSLTVTIRGGSLQPKGKNFTCNVFTNFHAFPFLGDC